MFDMTMVRGSIIAALRMLAILVAVALAPSTVLRADILSLTATGAGTSTIHAGVGVPNFSQMVVFGDSLSDVGNDAAFASLFGYVTSNGRFTSDPTSQPPSANTGVWHEELATKLGIARATRSSSGGSDWAYGGAVTGPGTSDFGIVHNVGRQLSDYLTSTSNTCPSDALYVVWAGGNDLLGAADNAGSGTVGVHAFESAAHTAATNLKLDILNSLAADGARYFVWPNLPALDQSPRARTSYNSSINAALADAVQTFNSDWSSAVQYIESVRPDVTIYACDVHSWFNELLLGTYPGYAFSNVTLAASSVTPVPASADTYLFWDQIHPTQEAHELLGDAAFDTIAVPEPGTLGLFGVGGIGLLTYLWRTRRPAKT
jgi:phospholipase/lecithinase/hemolysin